MILDLQSGRVPPRLNSNERLCLVSRLHPQLAVPAVAPPLRMGAAVGVADSLVFVHGGAAVGSNGFATSGILNDLTKLVSLNGTATGGGRP